MVGYLTTNENGEFEGSIQGLTEGTYKLKAEFEGDSLYNPSSNERYFNVRDPTINLSLSSSTQIIEVGDTITITATLTKDGLPFVGEEVEYDIITSSGTTSNSDFTNNAGEISISYTGDGSGDIEIVASYDSLEETLAIEDCLVYNTNKYTSDTTLNINLPVDSFEITYYMHRTNGTANSQGYSYLFMTNNSYDLLAGATGSLQAPIILGRATGTGTWLVQEGNTAYPNDVEILVKYVYNNNTHTVTLYNANDNSVISTATFTNSDYNPTKIASANIGNRNKAENIKVKKL